MKLPYYLLLLFPILNFSCDQNKPQKFVNDFIDTCSIQVFAKGEFVNKASDHPMSGTALFISDKSNNKFLRFENFSVINGPDVNIYLSTTSDYKEVIDLGEIKGTNGNIHYDFDDAINTDEYRFALVWCKKYKVNFGYAELKNKSFHFPAEGPDLQ